MNEEQEYDMMPDDIIDDIKLSEATDLEFELDDVEPDEVSESDEDIIELFDEHYAMMTSDWDSRYNDMEKDWGMYLLDHWSESALMARKGRPHVTIDISRKFVKQVTKEVYKYPPSIKLTSRGARSDKKTEFISNALRYFEDRSGAIKAYVHATEGAAVGGLGFFKVGYEEDDAQEIPVSLAVYRVEDPLSIMIDPDSEEIDGSDMLYAVEIHCARKDNEKFTYWWIDEDGIVKWSIIHNSKIIDKGVFPGRYIPIFPVYGESYLIRGERTMFGMIRQLKDTQRAYNYTVSEGIERLALAPKPNTQYQEGSIDEAHKKDWMQANTEGGKLLEYKVVNDATGQPITSPPTKTDSNPDTTWLTPMMTTLEGTCHSITGIYPDSFGNKQGGAEANVAIKNRRNASDGGQLVYTSNLNATIRHAGVVMLDLLDPLIAPAGLLPLMNEKGEKSVITIGEQPDQPVLGPDGRPLPMLDQFGQMMLDVNGIPMPQMQQVEPDIDDLDVTSLEISISTAASYGTRREEGTDKMIQILPMLNPEQQSLITPKLIEDLDFPGSDEYSNILNPQSDTQDPKILSQQIQQMNQQLQQANQANQQLQQDNQQLNLALTKNTQAMMGVAQIKANADITKTQMVNERAITETGMKINAGAMSDDKTIYAKADLSERSNRINLAKMMEQSRQNSEKLQQEASVDNANLALKAKQQQQDLIDKIEVQPTQIVPVVPRQYE